jgi:uncharacterized membrane protein
VSSPSEITGAGDGRPAAEGIERPLATPPSVAARARELWAFLGTPRGQLTLAWSLVTVTVLVDILLVGQRAIVRYQSYHADAFDLGNMDQAVWNTLHGQPFRMTNRGLDTVGPPTRLSIHVEPILLLIAPLYLIHAGPETLLALQTIALALGAIPLFMLGLRRLHGLLLVAAAFALVYLVTPEVLGSALWDFHPVALATPLLLLAVWALDARRYGWFAAAAFLAAMTKEDVALSLIPLGIFIGIWQGRPRFGWTVVSLSILWVALCFLVILPHFSGAATGGNAYWYRYAHFGNTPGSALVYIVTHPWALVAYVLGDGARRGYLALLVRTGGGLGIFMPLLWIPALPELAVNVLSAHWEQYSGFYQYNAMLGAYLMAAAVYGTAALYSARRHVGSRARIAAPGQGHAAHPEMVTNDSTTDTHHHHMSDSHTTGGHYKRVIPSLDIGSHFAIMSEDVGARWHALLARIPIPSRWLAPLVVVWLVVTTLWNLAAISPRLDAFWTAGAGPIRHQAPIDALLARVPASASVAATDTLNPHLSDRYTLYLLPDPQSYAADYAAFDIAAAPAFDLTKDRAILQRMLASGHYTVVGMVGSVILLHRTGPPLTAQRR